MPSKGFMKLCVSKGVLKRPASLKGRILRAFVQKLFPRTGRDRVESDFSIPPPFLPLPSFSFK